MEASKACDSIWRCTAMDSGSTPDASTTLVDIRIHRCHNQKMSIPRNCKVCGILFAPLDKEERRRAKIGQRIELCSRSCVAVHSNKMRPTKTVELVKKCKHCSATFQTKSGKLEKFHCSRSCASAGSVTEARRNVHKIHGLKLATFKSTTGSKEARDKHINLVAKSLKAREAWKYARIKSLLEKACEKHEFEMVISGVICDLVLPERKLIIEFDGPEHSLKSHSKSDLKRDCELARNGWSVHRVYAKPRAEIDPLFLIDLLQLSLSRAG